MRKRRYKPISNHQQTIRVTTGLWEFDLLAAVIRQARLDARQAEHQAEATAFLEWFIGANWQRKLTDKLN